MTFRCRMLDCEITERNIEASDATSAPDCFVAQNVPTNPGDVVFVEVQVGDGTWRLWEVEALDALAAGSRMFRTASTTREKVMQELAEHALETGVN